MGRARDNLNSSRSREDIDRDAEARRRVAEFKLHMLGAFDPETYRAVVAALADSALDKRVNIKTRTQAQLGYERAAGNLVRESPTFNIDNRTGVFTMQDFLREAVSGAADAGALPHTTGCGSALPDPQITIGLPNGGASAPVSDGPGDHRPNPPEVIHQEATAPVPSDGPPAASCAPTATAAAAGVPRSPEPVRCPDCHASWEPGHERACPVPPETTTDAM